MYRQLTTEDDIECTIAKMNAGAYNKAYNARTQKRVYQRQRKVLFNSLVNRDYDNKTFIHRYEDIACHLLVDSLKNEATRFLGKVESKLSNFIKAIPQFVVTDVYESAENQAARAILQNWLVDFSPVVEQCRGKFLDQEDGDTVCIIGSRKRQIPDDELASPSQRVKLEDD